MFRRKNIRRICSNSIYTTDELAEVLGCKPATIRKYISNGMPADKSSIPYYINGKEAKTFLENKTSRSKLKLDGHLFICHGCLTKHSLKETAECITTTGRVYRQGKYQIVVKGTCPLCGRKYSRIKSYISNLELAQVNP